MPTSAETIKRLQRQQAALAAFGSFAFREADLLTILNHAAQACAEGLDVPFCKVCEYRKIENDLLVVAGYGWQNHILGMVTSRANTTSPQGRAYCTGEPVMIENLALAENFNFPHLYEQHGIVSSLDVIIRGKQGTPYGVLEIDSQEPRHYDAHDVAFLTGFANILAEAVATAKRLETMQRLLTERQIFAEELKHRVRNNLQLINGMLTAHQRGQANNSDERLSINAIIRRIMALAEVYDQLLGTGLARTIDFGEYLVSLCNALPSLHNIKIDERRIVLNCQIERLLVGLDTVTALGMAVAELVSNSFAHAAPAAEPLVVDISLSRAETEQQAILRVRDNGPGFVAKETSKRHGVGLVRRLVEQVRGESELTSEGHTEWTIRFPLHASPATMAQDGGGVI